jgi:hypothetical protein
MCLNFPCGWWRSLEHDICILDTGYTGTQVSVDPCRANIEDGGVLSYWPKLPTFTIKQDFGGLYTHMLLLHWKENTGCPELRTLIFQWDEVWCDGRDYSNKYRPNLYFSWVELFVVFCLDRKFASWTLLPFLWWGISRNVKWPIVCSQTIFCIGQQKGVMGLSGLWMGSDEAWPSWKAIKNAGMTCSLLGI